MKKVKIGLIGCGGMASFYRQVYTQIPNAQLSFVVGLDSDEPQKIAAELNCPNYSTDYMDLINSDVDIVDISTPNFLHLEQFRHAVNSGKHVLLQKPIAASIEDAAEILRISRNTEKKVGMFMSKRCCSAFHEMKKIIKSGAIGTVTSVYARSALIRKVAATDAANWRNSVEKTGGGALMQLAIHDYDLLSWITGRKITSISAFSQNMMSPHIGGDDSTQTLIRFEDGLTGCVETSYCSKYPEIVVYATGGKLRYDANTLSIIAEKEYCDSVIEYTQPGTPLNIKISMSNKELYTFDNPYEQHAAFVNSVLQNCDVPVTIEDGFRSFMVVKAAYHSSENGHCVNIDEFIKENIDTGGAVS